MEEYSTTKCNDELFQLAQSLIKNGAVLLPSNNVIYSKRKGNTILVKGLFFKTTITTKKRELGTLVKMKTRFRAPIIFLSIFTLVFLLAFLFGNNVTINGNPNPNIIDKSGFVLVGFTIFSIPFAILINSKSRFQKKLEKELGLKKTTANNA